MQIVKQEDVKMEALVSDLRAGKVIVYPTETCYALGCDATNAGAVQRVFDIKQRQKNKPVLVLVPDESMMLRYVPWSPKMSEIAERYWPGALTVVSPMLVSVDLPPGVMAEDHSIAFRVTSHTFVQEVTESLGVPLVSTSANIATHENPYDIETILNMYDDVKKQPDLIVDAGPLPHRSSSTIVRVVGEHLEILRQGEVVVNA